MDPPTLFELQHFTLNCYSKLLKYLQQNYKIVRFCDMRYGDTPYLILRHDIDISLEDALTMATIEKKLNIKSTYFVLFSSIFYNLFEGENMAILKRISGLGHEIGLHYHPAQYRLYNRNPKKTLQIQANFLEDFLGKKVSSIARHGPYDRDPFTSSRYMNANDPYLRGDLFVHDSCRAWATMEGLTTLLSEPLKRVQLLVHPENWQNNKIGREKLLERHCQILKSKTDEEKKDLLKVYRTDPLVLDYDKSIKKFKITQVDQRLPLNRRLRYDSLSIVRYHFKHTRIGWNVNKLTYKIRDIKDLFF